MNTNYSSNNYNQSFGRFHFSDDAKGVIMWRVKSKAKLAKFEKLCNMENSGERAARNIKINAITNLAGGYELVANYGGSHYEKFFDTPLSFLKRVIKRADAIDKHFNSPVTKAIDKLI